MEASDGYLLPLYFSGDSISWGGKPPLTAAYFTETRASIVNTNFVPWTTISKSFH
jgi:hypothetical protein